MATTSIQDRTPEFRSILSQAQRRLQQSKRPQDRQHLLPNGNGSGSGASTPPPTRKQRSEFARNAAQIGRGIAATMGKLERSGQLAKRKTSFDDRPVEIAESTYVIKQDSAASNQQISSSQSSSKTEHPSLWTPSSASAAQTADQSGAHSKNVVVSSQGKLADVGANFKEVLEVRTKNIQASRSRQDNFVASVSHQANALAPASRTDSPLYAPPSRGRSPGPGQPGNSGGQDLLTLEPPSSSSSSASARTGGPQSEQQMSSLEEGQSSNTYISQRGEAIESIERTISESGGIFGQSAQMVSEQSEMIQRIDANTEDVVDNVEGAQRESMKYWGRVQGNRWLVAKMFGVLMIFFLLWVLIAG